MTDPRNILPDPEPATVPTPAHAAAVPPKTQMLTDELYKVLKFIAMTFLPAVGTLYFALASIWGLPAAEKVIGSITAFDLFLGLLLGISTTSYNNSDTKYDGSLTITPHPDTDTTSVKLNVDPNSVVGKDEALLEVKTPLVPPSN